MVHYGGQYFNGIPERPSRIRFNEYLKPARADSSPYRGQGTDGKDIGADIDAIEEATSSVIDGSD